MPLPQLFISYDQRDKNYVDGSLCKVLEEVGLTFRKDDLPFGASFFDFVDRAIRECFAAIVVISNNYVDNTSWARMEFREILARAIRGRFIVIPLRIDPVNLDALPFGLQTLAPINDERRLEDHLKKQLLELRTQLHSAIASTRASIVQASGGSFASERRIRVQVTNNCSMQPRCPHCHWDEFDQHRGVNQPRVRRIMEAIARTSPAATPQPAPRIAFTLTGGEPLDLPPEELEQFLSVCPKGTHVITNGQKLGLPRVQQILAKYQDTIAIRVHDPNSENEANRRRLQQGLATLLTNAPRLKIRFNSILDLDTDNPRWWVDQVSNRLENISRSYCSNIPSQITGIAFIEPYYAVRDPRPSTCDIFSVAKAWSTATNHKLQESPQVPRRRHVLLDNDLSVEFLKVNCAAHQAPAIRCLNCVVEKDICIAADGTVRICSGWDPVSLQPHYGYAFFTETAPLIGISAAIRRQYGVAGFYGHLPALVALAQGRRKNIHATASQFNDLEFDRFLYREAHENFETDKYRQWTFLPEMIKILLRPDTPFVRLYREGVVPPEAHKRSVTLCTHLLNAAYAIAEAFSTSEEASRPHLRQAFILILLILEYLTVDESMFWTGRTLLAQGVSAELLRGSRDCALEGPALADALFCIGAIAMEGVDMATVSDLLDLYVADLQEFPQVTYIQGCLKRQNLDTHTAEGLFRRTIDLSGQALRASGQATTLSWMCPELLVEGLRSLGSCLKHSDTTKSRDLYAEAEFLSIAYDTKLRYQSLFSDGYASMRAYFQTDDKVRRDDLSRRALRDFADSLALNPTFYACLLRIAILELTLGLIDRAAQHLKTARQSFAEKGLLTDQEHLNSVLCEIAFALTDPNAVAPSIGIQLHRHVGRKDVECVRDDAVALNAHFAWKGDWLQHQSVQNALRQYIEQCNNIIGKEPVACT